MSNAKQTIETGKAVLGIEFGSTRIKAVLVNETGEPIASGAHDWENRLEDGIWTYSLDDIWTGLTDCYGRLAEDVKEKYDTVITSLAAIGFSGMMHGYMPFNAAGELLVPFRTWRNTQTSEACKKLIPVFNFNIPQRWSIAHLYQAILNGEEHVPYVDFFTTLAGYVHWRLTGRKVLGVGDASGMFPIDIHTGDYDQAMIQKFDKLVADQNYRWNLRDILPRVLAAGEEAGVLTEEGASLLDPSGDLQAGIPLCPPEGDAGTGMVATNSVAKRTGNISAGTSIFAMVVLEKELSKVYPQIDLVTTPDGALVGMVHCNNCTSDINAWVNLFRKFGEMYGLTFDMNDLFTRLYSVALKGDPDCGGMISYNYFSGEPVTGFDAGAPLFVRDAESKFTLANTMRMHLYSALAALKSGMDLMLKEEGVQVDQLFGHGGYFKTKGVGQRYLAAAVGAPVTVMDTASEGGAWGIALLAAYLDKKDGEKLEDFLDNRIFKELSGETIEPAKEEIDGFDAFMDHYKAGLEIEKSAIEHMKW